MWNNHRYLFSYYFYMWNGQLRPYHLPGTISFPRVSPKPLHRRTKSEDGAIIVSLCTKVSILGIPSRLINMSEKQQTVIFSVSTMSDDPNLRILKPLSADNIKLLVLLLLDLTQCVQAWASLGPAYAGTRGVSA